MYGNGLMEHLCLSSMSRPSGAWLSSVTPPCSVCPLLSGELKLGERPTCLHVHSDIKHVANHKRCACAGAC